MSFEDCIDVVRDWVIAQAYATIAYVDAEIATLKAWVQAQAYATEAWVLGKDYQSGADMPEWTMPLSVTGNVNPDVKCTYLKTGIHNGQPYFLRTDGAYFIWWNGVNRWYITEELGVDADPRWIRFDPNRIGGYFAVPPVTGTAFVAEGYAYLKTSFIDRGDPAAADFTTVDFTKDGAWHELDLSGIVPDGAKGVCIFAVLLATAVNKVFSVRRAGNVNSVNVSSLSTQAAGIVVVGPLICPVSEDRKIDYQTSAAGITFINFTVGTWWP